MARVGEIANFLRSPQCRSVSILTGAGMSVPSGIPDFRSPGGMYDTLRPELLTASSEDRAQMSRNPTHVVSWDLFSQNQLPYLELRKPFILGTLGKDSEWKPTLAHFLAKVLHEKGKLGCLFTQNIDGLDLQLGLPNEKVLNIHGSLGRIQCEFCKAYCDDDVFLDKMTKQIKDIYNPSNGPTESTPINCDSCRRPGLKPTTVLYGRSLPETFEPLCNEHLPGCDLLFVMGTSLTVYPAAGIPDYVGSDCRRVLINAERVGNFKLPPESATDEQASQYRDHFLQVTCDKGVFDVFAAAGWLGDLEKHKAAMCDASRKMVEGLELEQIQGR